MRWVLGIGVATSTALIVTALACGRDLDDPAASPGGADGTTPSPSLDGTLPDASACEPSTDLMTDSKHCGACGHDCLGGGCARGKCLPVLLTTGELVPRKCALPATAETKNCFIGTYSNLAVDDTHIYFGDFGTQKGSGTGGLLRLPKNVEGPTAPEVVANVGPVWGMSLGANEIVWQNTRIGRIPKQPGATAEWLDFSNGHPRLPPLLRDTEIVWASERAVHARTLMPGVDAGSDLADAGGRTVTAFGLDRDVVAWALDNGDIFFRRGSEPIRKVASQREYANAIALRDDVIYWANVNAGEVFRMPLDASPAAPESLGTTDHNPQVIALDEESLYVGTWGPCANTPCGIDGKVFRFRRSAPPSEPELLDRRVQLVSGLAVDDKAIYWSTWWVTAVFRLAK